MNPLLLVTARAVPPPYADPGPDDDDPPGPLDWQERALCAQTDPEAFFPEKGGSTAAAKRVCMSCEVRVQCLDYALDNDERFGIWGGLSERERRRHTKRAAPAPDPGHLPLSGHCGPGGVLAAAGYSHATVQGMAGRGTFIPHVEKRSGVRLYDTAAVAEWLAEHPTPRTRKRAG